MLAVLLLLLLAACVTAPWLGADSSDQRSESSRPTQGWHPLLADHPTTF